MEESLSEYREAIRIHSDFGHLEQRLPALEKLANRCRIETDSWRDTSVRRFVVDHLRAHPGGLPGSQLANLVLKDVRTWLGDGTAPPCGMEWLTTSAENRLCGALLRRSLREFEGLIPDLVPKVLEALIQSGFAQKLTDKPPGAEVLFRIS